ncbi:hypothetical protein BDV96DRAFT_645755 [Lophiotrema nucula]|uniref:Ecp2 effector protein domain-containing protein n=1 Tax=Lophiotrema nucula TaxID=690887 RepID=A0A6A5ZCF4_9PLEO|nr:hypothetical protein BDV96DRAFT_645755 [Lophiotrema nucula]
MRPSTVKLTASLLLATSIAALPSSSSSSPDKSVIFDPLAKRQTALSDDQLCHAYCSILTPDSGMATLDEVEQLAVLLDAKAAAGEPCIIQRPQGSTDSATTQLAVIGTGDTAKEARIYFSSGPDIDSVYWASYNCANVAEVLRDGLKVTCGGFSKGEGHEGFVYGAADVSNCYHPYFASTQQTLTLFEPGVKVEVVLQGWPIHVN